MCNPRLWCASTVSGARKETKSKGKWTCRRAAVKAVDRGGSSELKGIRGRKDIIIIIITYVSTGNNHTHRGILARVVLGGQPSYSVLRAQHMVPWPWAEGVA